jgi:hypothetical protein
VISYFLHVKYYSSKKIKARYTGAPLLFQHSRKLGQEDYKFKSNMGYAGDPISKKKERKKKKSGVRMEL